MKYFKMKALAGAVVLSMVSLPAAAQIPVTDVAGIAAINAVTNAVASVTKAIGVSTSSITSSDQANTQNLINAIGSMSTRVEGQVKAGYESNIEMMKVNRDTENTQSNYREQLKNMVTRASAIRGAPCEDVTAVAAAAIGKASGGAAGGGVRSNRDALIKAVTSISPQREAIEKAKIHEQKYCGPGDKQCSVVTDDYQHADQLASSLFTGASASGKVSLTFDAKQLQAADDFINNVFKSIPSPRLDEKIEATPQGQAYMTLHRSEASKMSLARKAASDNRAAKDAKNAEVNGTPLGTLLRDMLKEQKSLVGVTVPDRISFAQMTDIEATRRYANPEWYGKVAALSDQAQVLKEIAYMQALEINQRHQQIKQMEHLLVVNSALLQEITEMNMSPKLAAQRDAAIRSAR